MSKHTIEVEIETKHAEPNKGFMPMAGWHDNYCDGELDGKKVTMTFISGCVSLHIGSKTVHKINCAEIFSKLLEAKREA